MLLLTLLRLVEPFSLFKIFRMNILHSCFSLLFMFSELLWRRYIPFLQMFTSLGFPLVGLVLNFDQVKKRNANISLLVLLALLNIYKLWEKCSLLF